MDTLQFVIHYFLHLVFPAWVAYRLYNNRWLRTYIVFLLTMLVDLDHLLAIPVFEPCRCSIGFHPLHSPIACAVYVLMLIHPRTRVIAIGLLMHMATDGIDCIFSRYNC